MVRPCCWRAAAAGSAVTFVQASTALLLAAASSFVDQRAHGILPFRPNARCPSRCLVVEPRAPRAGHRVVACEFSGGAGADALINWKNFGSPLRNGYEFWLDRVIDVGFLAFYSPQFLVTQVKYLMGRGDAPAVCLQRGHPLWSWASISLLHISS